MLYTHTCTHTHTCLGFACGATGVQDEERVLGITPLRFTLILCLVYEFMPPQVNSLIPGYLQKEDRKGQERTLNTAKWGQEINGTWKDQSGTGRWGAGKEEGPWEGGMEQRDRLFLNSIW